MRGRRDLGRGEHTCIEENGIGRQRGMKQCRGKERRKHRTEGRGAAEAGSVMGGAADNNGENGRGKGNSAPL